MRARGSLPYKSSAWLVPEGEGEAGEGMWGQKEGFDSFSRGSTWAEKLRILI